jgi:hypothetical protein
MTFPLRGLRASVMHRMSIKGRRTCLKAESHISTPGRAEPPSEQPMIKGRDSRRDDPNVSNDLTGLVVQIFSVQTSAYLARRAVVCLNFPLDARNVHCLIKVAKQPK